MESEFILEEKIPSVKEFQNLRNAMNWPKVNDEAVARSLANSIYSVCIIYREEVIGFGRIIGDNGIYLYIQDMMILPEFQRRGLGTKLINKLLLYLKQQIDPTAFIGLMSAKGYSKFYEGFGFKKRDEDAPGMFKYNNNNNTKQ